MLIQKFHPGIRLGLQPTLAASGNPLFSRQGHWDGGSTLHCVAMTLALLDKLADPVYLPYHASGPEQLVWDDAWPHYLQGLTLPELGSFVAELNIGVRPATCTATGRDLLSFVQRELQAGWPVIVGWQQRHRVKWRAALVIGIEGRQIGGTFEPHAMLLIDPAGNEPSLAGFNARLDRRGDEQFRYQSPTAARDVRLLGGVSVRDINAAAVP
ncbi:hypothetical protein [Burkholderia aenigmatica]|uniref:Peptidase C39-like domain-containing protein n=1 Tax=Burkholderia aenigmatica TaxID=2015348 RepID=A0A228HH89_9BURK|nr:hypothetical protein [Burkholderia aenigmatica]OXI29544.1 hypothetical protein CFB84_43960 [Burkholderia aenigmatica]OXI47746.1 hypothetical protein CFB84_11095 [Burkholderia aenigmatica]